MVYTNIPSHLLVPSPFFTPIIFFLGHLGEWLNIIEYRQDGFSVDGTVHHLKNYNNTSYNVYIKADISDIEDRNSEQRMGKQG